MKTKKISPKSLEAAVDRYFASIRRTVVATERVETGPRTFEERPILSDTGEPIRCREYVVAPTVWGLCESRGITRPSGRASATGRSIRSCRTRCSGLRASCGIGGNRPC